MIETTEILDLTDGSTAERSNDDQLAHQGAVLASGHPHLPARQSTPNLSSLVSVHELSEVSPNDDASNSLIDADFKDVKNILDDLCPVCGDKVSGYHYGLLTCESCKGFFKRTVQNKKSYQCVDNKNCQIDKSQRKRCPFCRFQKCLKVGMKLEAVRSDRMRGGRNKFGPMYKRDRAMKQQQARLAQTHPDACGDLSLLPSRLYGSGQSPNSPEDVKPDPLVLQASLDLYSGAISNAPTSNIMSSFIPGLNCLSPIANTSPSASSGGGHNGSTPSSPPPAARPHSMSHTNHHSTHQVLVPLTISQGFSNSFGQLSALTVPDTQKTHYSQQPPQQQQQHHRHHHNSQLIHHQQQSPSPMENKDNNPQNHLRQQIILNQHMQALSSDIDLQPRIERRIASINNNNNTLGMLVQDNEASFSTSSLQASPNVIEDRRFYQIPNPNNRGQPQRLMLPPIIKELKSTMGNELEVKQKILALLHNELSQTNVLSDPNQFFPILCRIVDQLLFLLVEWARNSSFFREIKVEDQMELLHNCWSEILILDFIYRNIHGVWGRDLITPGSTGLGNDLLDRIGLSDVKVKVNEIIRKGRELNMDEYEYLCLKFLILLNPDVSHIEDRSFIDESLEKVNAALLQYCTLNYPEMQDKFSQLLMRLPEIKMLSIRMEEYLYFKHVNSEVPDHTLLTEMLHAKKRG